MKLYIKYMVSLSCKALVKVELEKLEILFQFIDFGVVELHDDVSLKQRKQLKINLQQCGLNLHEAKKGYLIEKIERAIIDMIQYSDGQPILSYSIYLSEKLEHDYTYLANIFSEVNGISIQQFIIVSKIDMVKELLLYSDSNLSEISFNLHYSSVAHLSGQFKKITGLSPTKYKLARQKKEELEASLI